MMKTHHILCLSALLVCLASAIHVRKNDQTPLIPDKQPDTALTASPLHRITLKKTVISSEEKRKSIELLATAQSYHFSKKDFSDKNDFVASQRERADLHSNSSGDNSGEHNLKLYNFKNVQYTGALSIGELGNTFNVIYDTGSANIWINSKHCTDSGCKNHKQYDSSKSKTYEKVGLDLDVQFGTGELIGEFAKDTVFFGDVEVQNQEFVEIFEERGGIFEESHFDGIVGLAFPTMAAYNKNPLFDNLMKQQRVKDNVFSFYMSPRDGKSDSEITVGGIDENRFTGEIKYHKVLKDYYWLVAADNILVGGQDVGVCRGGCYVIADTGTSVITGPTDSILQLMESIEVSESCSNIDKLPDLTFVLDGTHYTLTGEEYVLQESNGSMSSVEAAKANLEMGNMWAQCAPAFMPLDIPNDDDGFKYEKAWILGDTFLQKYYSVYDRDNGRVGFAKSRN